jgi:eukaryotic-like serine/threonine-protein kinase
MSSSITRSLGKYRLIALLAQGGMGDVWLAVSCGPAGFSKLVVIKELRSTFVHDAPFLRMFLEEARLSARLSHPNIVQTYEVGEERGTLFIAMEYLDGQSLHRLRRRSQQHHGRALPLALELPVLLATLRALEYAHEFDDYDGTPLRVVHRDVSPQNVMVTYDGQVKLLDFGIAKALDTSEETRTGTIKGKITYMSPEQAVADDIDHRTDIFGLGVLLAEAICGERFWPKLPQARIFARLVRGELPTIRDRAQNAPEALIDVCERAISVDREARYASARAMRMDLEAVLAAHPELRSSAHDTAAHLAEAFAPERAEVRACIDAQLRTVRSAESAGVQEVRLLSLDAYHSDTASLPAPAAFESASHPSRPSSLAPLSATVRPPNVAASVSSLNTTRSPDTASVSINAVMRPSRPLRVIAVAATLGVIGVFVVMLFIAARSMEARRAAAAATAAPPASTDALPAATASTAPAEATATTNTGDGASPSPATGEAADAGAPSTSRSAPTWHTPPRAPAKRPDLDIRLSR